MKEPKVTTCCVCDTVFEGFGANPEPFPGDVGTCCPNCDATWVVPVRVLYGRSGHGAPLEMLRKLANIGAGLREANAIGRRMAEEMREKNANDNRHD